MRSVFRVLLIPIVCVAIGMHPRLMLAQTPADGDPVALAIQAQLDALMHPEEVEIQGARIALRELVQEFYSRREFRAAWSNARNAEQLRKALADSYDDGLDPADYHLRLLEKLSQQVAQPTATDVLRAQYDVLLTEALLRLAYHLSFGKVDPETFDAQWNYGRTLASTGRRAGSRAGPRRRGRLSARRSPEAHASAVRRTQARAGAISRRRWRLTGP